MMKVSKLCGIVLIGSVAFLAAGCSSTTPVSSGGTVKAVTPSDLRMLAGTWQGTGVGATGDSVTATLRLKEDGAYTLEAGPWTAQGKAEVKDGGLQFVAAGGATGRGDVVAGVGQRTGSAVLMDEGTNWALVGSGLGGGGPYHFGFRKPK